MAEICLDVQSDKSSCHASFSFLSLSEAEIDHFLEAML